jgi:hypothetical protein
MAEGLFTSLVDRLKAVADGLADKRRAGHDRKYEIRDAVLSAFAVFFIGHPSLLSFARAMREKKKRDNLESIFGVFKIPSDPQIRDILDQVEPGELGHVFREELKEAEKRRLLESYRVLGGGVLLAMDGVWYFHSEEVHCSHCLYAMKDGIKTYYHSALAGVLVRPGSNDVIPVEPEMIRNSDVTEEGESYEKQKQDCEIKAMKRWLEAHGEEYAYLKPTYLGDNLYAKYPVCKKIEELGSYFLFTCKKDSHKWISECKDDYDYKTKDVVKWDSKSRARLQYHYEWASGVEIRQELPTMEVNLLYFEIKNTKTGKITYKNSWITNRTIDENNVELIASCARTRWKIENEHNNVLKNHGFNFEHNFGHGKEHACEVFCTLILLAFMFHTLLDLGDKVYHDARLGAGRRDTFFASLQFALRWFFFKNWPDFISFVLNGPPGS